MAQGGGGGGGRPQALRRVTEPMAGNDTKSETERSDYWIEMKRSLQREDGDDLIPEDTERFGGSRVDLCDSEGRQRCVNIRDLR